MAPQDEHAPIERVSRSRLAINFAPLIDVVFLLLIFFMLTSSFVEPAAIVLQLPTGETTVAEPETESIVLRVAVDGTITLRGEPVELDEVTERITALIARDPERAVWIRAEREVPVQWTVRVMDRVREAGGENIKFITRFSD